MDPAVQSALISAGVAILVLRVNYIMNKRSERVQREIANQNIDANVVAKARLKWIEEVRKLTTELISNVSTVKIIGYEVIRSSKKFDEEKDFVKSVNQPLNDSSDIAIYQPEVSEDFKNILLDKLEDQDKFNHNQFKISSIAENLILYFSPQKEHFEISEHIKWFQSSQNRFNERVKEEKYEEAEIILEEFNFKVVAFRIKMQVYLKKEWEKAKKGK